MLPIPVTPRLALFLLLLLGAAVGWDLATGAEDKSWLAFVAAWAGASAGILAMPLFEFLAKPLPDPMDHRTLASSVTAFAFCGYGIATSSWLAISGHTVAEVIAKGFLCGFLPTALFGVQDSAYLGTRWIGEKLHPPAIFSLSVFGTMSALNVFAFDSRIVEAGLLLIAIAALIYAAAQLQFCIILWTSTSARNYSALQSLQILALIFGIGLSLGAVTSWLS